METCESLQPSAYEQTESGRLIWSAAASLVSRLVRPADGKDKKMTDISGLRCFASWQSAGQGGYWAKTSQGYCQSQMFADETEEHLEPFSMTWPRWGIVSDGLAMALETSGHRTKGIGSLFWPTPQALDGIKGGPNSRFGRGNPHLPSAVFPQNWPTPRANDAEKRGNIADDPRNGLPAAAKMWATPAAWDCQGASGGGQGRSLRTDIDCAEPQPWPGWPAPPGPEQYDYEPPRTVRAQKHRVKRVKCIGNAVNPYQVLPILLAIAEVEIVNNDTAASAERVG